MMGNFDKHDLKKSIQKASYLKHPRDLLTNPKENGRRRGEKGSDASSSPSMECFLWEESGRESAMFFGWVFFLV